MKFKDIVYMVLDEIKMNSDDAFITEEHAMFLLNKYRTAILYQTYKDIKKEIPESNYQTICLDLEVADVLDDPCAGSTYLRSKEAIPNTMTIGTNTVYPTDYYANPNITLISRDRMKFVGHNKWLRNIIYCSIGADNHLYFTSNNPQHLYLEKVKFTGVFEDTEEAAKLSCDDESTSCDILEKDFPLEESLVPLVIQSVVKELLGIIYRPEDNINNANDETGSLTNFIARNTKSALSKQLDDSQ